MKFSDIPGLASVKERLIRSVNDGKVAHAQLFSGTPGALNLPLALAYTTFLHCSDRKENDSCGVCAACSKSSKYIHPDTHFVFPIGNIKGDKDDDRFRADILKTWRAFLLEQSYGTLDDWAAAYGGEDKQANISREESREIIRALSLKSFESPFKVMIIWLPEYMHPSASNGILKILEEPPANTFFILVSNAADRLLPTVLSRLQIVQIPLLSDHEVEGWLKQFTDDPTKITQAVRFSEGNAGLAKKLLDAEESSYQQLFADWMRACFRKEYARLVAMADEFHESDKTMQRNFLQYCLGMLRETLLHRSGAVNINRAKGGELKFIQDFSKVMTVDKIEMSGQLISESSIFLERNGSAKMIFLDLSLQVSKMF
jgi:DNA polymerase-3 subunit delta'